MLTTILLLIVIILIITNIDKDHSNSKHENFCENCNSFYYGNQCLSPYCGSKWWWYNEFTPFVWGNPTRAPKWYYPYYTYIIPYYADYYL